MKIRKKPPESMLDWMNCRSDESKFEHVGKKGIKLMLCGIINVMLCNHSDVPYNFISLCFTADKTNKWPDY